MCGRFTLTRSPAEIVDAFDLVADEGEGLRPRYNVAPSQEAAVVVMESGARHLAWKRWGLVPSWADDPGIAARTINARIETAAEKPAFRDAVAHRRCLVPADGFYEWLRRGSVREPHHVRLPGLALFAFAGLHEAWEGPAGRLERSFTLLTCDAHPAIRWLHDRMPALVPPSRWDAWLDPAACDPVAALALPDPALAAAFETVAVDSRVNSPRYDDEACLAPAAQLSLL
jgi:putative SOS response-associated peptidase YedK